MKNTIKENTIENTIKNIGATETQIEQLTVKIDQLNGHLQIHKKDQASKTGLMRIVGQRRSLLDYLRETDVEGYRAIISKLGLRK